MKRTQFQVTCYFILLWCIPFATCQTCTDGTIRLLGDDHGRLEVCVGGRWGTVCSDFWQNQDASVACRELGFSEYGAIAAHNPFTESLVPMHIIDLNCTGSEQSIFDCPHNALVRIHPCESGHEALLRCQEISVVSFSNCSDGAVRLTGGMTEYEGRVEICINRAWGSICYGTSSGNTWDTIDGRVVCLQLGYQDYGISTTWRTTKELYGAGGGPVFLAEIHCTGMESTLLECPHTVLSLGACSHDRDVGVRCEAPCESGTIRLVSDSNSYFRSHGRVEVCIDQTWSTICDENFGNSDASVICRQLGYSPYGTIGLQINENHIGSMITNVTCTGSEKSFLQCNHNKTSTCNINPGFVICQYGHITYSNCSDGEIRLAGKVTATSGRLEICYNKAWGTVCDSGWNAADGLVACRELGFQQQGSSISTSTPSYSGYGSGPIFLYRTDCTGAESALRECASTRYPFWRTGCNHFRDLTLNCTGPCRSGDVKLVSSELKRAGAVRVCLDGLWGTVCGPEQNPNLASVICRQLGYSKYGAFAGSGLWTDNNYLLIMSDPVCHGNESNILSCQYSTTIPYSCRRRNSVTSVLCISDSVKPSYCREGDIRLQSGSFNRGRVEICRGGVWGSVCATQNTVDALVMCRMLGFHGVDNMFSTIISSQVPVMFYSFYCRYAHHNLSECDYPSGILVHLVSLATCTQWNVLEIQCEVQPEPCNNGDVHIADGDGKSYGRVEVCFLGTWRPICADSFWDNTDASIICKQLGFPQLGSLATPSTYPDRTKNDIIHSVQCNGTEESIFDCDYRNRSNFYCAQAGIVCHVQNDVILANCSEGEARLVDGPSPNKGRLVVCVNQNWATVCPNRFIGGRGLRVACKQLGYQEYGARYHFYGRGSGMIYGFGCSGFEDSLTKCSILPHELLGDCSHRNDVGLQCELPCVNGSIRLSGSSFANEGRVEVCVNNTWGTICTDYWDSNDIAVACRQLGYLANGSSAIDPSYTFNLNQFKEPWHIFHLDCVGTEDTLWNCPQNKQIVACNQELYSATLSCPAGVISDPEISSCTDEQNGTIRLVGGSLPSEGLVEICLDGEWGTLCYKYGYYEWTYRHAEVVCHQLGFIAAGSYERIISNYQRRATKIYLIVFSCSGSEQNLTSCTQSIGAACTQIRRVGVVCRVPCQHGEVRLVGNPLYDNVGRVEVCINSTWGKVCRMNTTHTDASVICKQLGYAPQGAIIRPSRYSLPRLDYFIATPNCSGSEDRLLDCSYSLKRPEHICNFEAGVLCQDPPPFLSNCTDYDVRLHQAEGESLRKGVLQICLNGAWGAVCNGGVKSGAPLICAQLGFPGDAISMFAAVSLPDDEFLVESIYCDNYDVNGNISQCTLNFYTKDSTCNDRYSAGLHCQVRLCTDGEVRLNGSTYVSHGRVEVCIDGNWGIVCGRYWDERDASVVCRQLGFSPHGAIHSRYMFSEYTQQTVIYDLNCTGSEDSLLDCPHNALDFRCPDGDNAVIFCQSIDIPYANCTNGEIRTVEGEVDNETLTGMLQICSNNVWFSIHPSQSWTRYEHLWQRSLACKLLAPSDDIQYKYMAVDYISILNKEELPKYPLDFFCSSSSKRLLQCVVFSTVSNNREAVGITCTTAIQCSHGDVRLHREQYGRVEVCVNGTWGTICSDYWDKRDASVLCRELGYSPNGAVALLRFFSNRRLPFHIHDINCNGSERSIFNCSYNTLGRCNSYVSFSASVICQVNPVVSECEDGDIRLAGGPTALEGRVEVCLNNAWGTVCYNSFGTVAAGVVCGQLGFQRANATFTSYSHYGTSTAISYMRYVRCTGSENRLFDCPHSTITDNDCGDGRNAGVQCLDTCVPGDVHLVGLNSTSAGRVELCVERTWTTICDNYWDNRDASVLCRQLGFSPYGAIAVSGSLTEGVLSFGITDIHCNGTEQNISLCDQNEAQLHNCQSHNDAGVVCQDVSTSHTLCNDGQVRLLRPSQDYGHNEGRVEVCINSVWGSVCDESWTTSDANVVCRQLHFIPRGAVPQYNAYFGMGSGPILLSHLNCTGSEASLLECGRYDMYGTVGCTHHNDAGVTCEVPCRDREVRLVPFYPRTGRLEVCFNNSWGTICTNSWDYLDASVVCRQLGYSLYGSLALSGFYQTRIWPPLIYDISCTESQTSLWDCDYSFFHGERTCASDASVVCQASETEFSNCTNGELRLVNGTIEMEGRIEICYGNAWGTICDEGWDVRDANVVCRHLGHRPRGATLYKEAYFGEGEGPIFVRQMRCTGYESYLPQCSWTAYQNNGACYHSQDAGVRCQAASPTLNISAQVGIEDVPVIIHLSAHSPGVNLSEIIIRIAHFPIGSSFNRGTFSGHVWILTSNDFGDVELSLPAHLSGTIQITAEALYINSSRSSVGTVQFIVRPVADVPILKVVYDHCIDSGRFSFVINSSLVDTDGSETLLVIVSGLPDGSLLSVGETTGHGDFILQPSQLRRHITATLPSNAPDTIQVVFMAKSVESLNNDSSISRRVVSIDRCVSVPVTDKAFNGCSGEVDNAWTIEWPNTMRGETAVQSCPGGPSTIGNAIRSCDNNGIWSDPDVLQCTSVEIVHLQKKAKEILSTSNTETQILLSTAVTEELTQVTASQNKSLLPKDLQTSVKIVSTVIEVLENNNDTADTVLDNVADIFSNVLDDSNMIGWKSLKNVSESEKLLDTAERYAVVVASVGNVSNSVQQYRQRKSRPNIVVSAQKFGEEPPLYDLEFPDKDDLVNYTRNKKMSKIIVPHSVVRMRLEEVENEMLPVFFLLFHNLPMGDSIFSLSNLTLTKCTGETVITTQSTYAASEVVGANVGERTLFPRNFNASLQTPVHLNFSFDTVENGSNYRCAYWNFSYPFGNGSWVNAGVSTDEHFTYGDDTSVQCTSTHLTNFVVLVDVAGGLEDIEEIEWIALQIMSYVGCSISILCLLLTVIFFLSYGKKLFASVQLLIHLNFVLILLLSLIVFVTGVETATETKIGCTIVALLLHYLFLSSFCWMLCEGVMLYLLLVVVFSKMSKRIWPFLLIGYVIPIPIVAITVGLRYEYYGVRDVCGQLLYCWLSVEEGTIFGFVAPMLIIIIINVIFLFMTLYVLWRSKRNHMKLMKDKNKNLEMARAMFVGCIVLLPLLGLTWVFGILTVNNNTTVFAWLFTIFNSLQGLFVFLFHVVRNDKVWSKIKRQSYKVITRDTSVLSKATRNGNKTLALNSNDPNSSLGKSAFKPVDLTESIDQLSMAKQSKAAQEIGEKILSIKELRLAADHDSETKVDLGAFQTAGNINMKPGVNF